MLTHLPQRLVLKLTLVLAHWIRHFWVIGFDVFTDVTISTISCFLSLLLATHRMVQTHTFHLIINVARHLSHAKGSYFHPHQLIV